MGRRTWLSSCWIAAAALGVTALLGATGVGATTSGSPTGTPTPTPSATSWSIVTSPNDGTDSNALAGVACASADLCWAVGFYYDDTSNLDQTLIEEWDGTSWSLVTSPNGSFADTDAYSYLTGVACASATLCWAVGYYSGDYQQTLVEEWDGSGTTWNVVSSPDAGSFDDQLNGVTCASSTECWAVGTYLGSDEGQDILIEGWDGTSWTLNVPAADSETDSAPGVLGGVACAGADDCWAAGYSTGDFDQTLIEGWDGTSWSPAASPDSGTSDNDLYGVTCASSTECWAVGDYIGSDEGPHILILGLVSGSWTTSVGGYVETESAAGYLYGVACATAGECWAVGRATDGDGYDQVITEEWTGTSWSSVAAPDSSTPDTPYSGDVNNALVAAACVPAAECFAVGFYGYEADPTLIEEYPAAAAATPTPATVPVPNTGALAGSPWPAGIVAAVLGVLLAGTAVAWRRRGPAGSPDRSRIEI
ncbi:MAG: hypothetical protein ABSA40_06065 [Candidatus Dormibacteria bacterium]